MDQLFKRLKHKAEYSINSHSRDLVYQTYGMALMAWEADLISRDEFYQLNDMLIVNGLNNPANCKLD